MLLNNRLYLDDVIRISKIDIDWNMFKGKKFLISGISGMIGSFLTDVLLTGHPELETRIIALVRDEDRARKRFSPYLNDPRFTILTCDLNTEIPDFSGSVDYVIHGASNTHPYAYATAPIGTLMTSITGTENMLKCGIKHEMRRFVFLSSVEIYGENRGDVEYFKEDYCGYIDCNTVRANYPEGKRAGEALCQAYIAEKGVDIVIPRLSRIYGPTMLMSDTKAISQFIKNAVKHEDIILKSKGTQLYSYCYVADAVSGILYCLVKGENGNAYNIASPDSNISLSALAQRIAFTVGRQVVFDLPDEVEKLGFSKATKAMLDSSKIQELGWTVNFDIDEGIAHTVDIIRSLSGEND